MKRVRWSGAPVFDPVCGFHWKPQQMREIADDDVAEALLRLDGFLDDDSPAPPPLAKPAVAEPLEPGTAGKATFGQGIPVEGVPEREG